MEARMVTMTPKPGHLDDLAAFWDAAVVSEITDQEGAAGFVLLKDTANDRLVGVSLWASAAAADAAGGTFGSHMQTVGGHLAAPPSVTIAEVAASSAGVLAP
jgi:quinol monooxygenase YgiN